LESEIQQVPVQDVIREKYLRGEERGNHQNERKGGRGVRPGGNLHVVENIIF
jgi:hypothetical protein